MSPTHRRSSAGSRRRHVSAASMRQPDSNALALARCFRCGGAVRTQRRRRRRRRAVNEYSPYHARRVRRRYCVLVPTNTGEYLSTIDLTADRFCPFLSIALSLSLSHVLQLLLSEIFTSQYTIVANGEARVPSSSARRWSVYDCDANPKAAACSRRNGQNLMPHLHICCRLSSLPSPQPRLLAAALLLLLLLLLLKVP